MTAIVCHGDARDLPFPDDSIDLIVTSPPYFGLRSYTDGGQHYDTQIGAEATPQEFIAALVACTREMARVLKPSGSIFVNLGDGYVSRQQGYGATTGGTWAKVHRHAGDDRSNGELREDATGGRGRSKSGAVSEASGIPRKSLMLLPERYRIACVDELGLIARAVIVWAKPNGLPESVRDRVRRSHEDWVHLTKSPRYFEAVDEIREPASDYTRTNATRPTPGGQRPRAMADTCNPLGKLPGSVWSIATQPLKVPAELNVDHFAAFPMEWPRRLITGWCPREVCTACGEGRRPASEETGRVVSSGASRELGGIARSAWSEGSGRVDGNAEALVRTSTGHQLPKRERTVTGYACACPDTSAPSTPGTVLDPFGGTGTTALVADVLGRTGISLDASTDYGRIAAWRTTDPKQRERAGQAKPSKDLTLIGPAEEPEPAADPFDELIAAVLAAGSLEEIDTLSTRDGWAPEHEALAALRANELTGAAA